MYSTEQIHDKRLLQFFHKHDIQDGVRWEIARLISTGALVASNVKEEHIASLSGSNLLAAPRVADVMCPIASAADEIKSPEHYSIGRRVYVPVNMHDML